VSAAEMDPTNVYVVKRNIVRVNTKRGAAVIAARCLGIFIKGESHS
jgi:hypothetical protein